MNLKEVKELIKKALQERAINEKFVKDRHTQFPEYPFPGEDPKFPYGGPGGFNPYGGMSQGGSNNPMTQGNMATRENMGECIEKGGTNSECKSFFETGDLLPSARKKWIFHGFFCCKYNMPCCEGSPVDVFLEQEKGKEVSGGSCSAREIEDINNQMKQSGRISEERIPIWQSGGCCYCNGGHMPCNKCMQSNLPHMGMNEETKSLQERFKKLANIIKK